jgi:predicted SprT family Zn-dependent metalloprotease
MGERKQDEKIRELIASAAQATEVFADDALEAYAAKTEHKATNIYWKRCSCGQAFTTERESDGSCYSCKYGGPR